jgi:hypothetical protein
MEGLGFEIDGLATTMGFASTPEQVADALREMVETVNGQAPAPATASYQEAGVLTNDAGFVLTVGDSEFQVTVVQSR